MSGSSIEMYVPLKLAPIAARDGAMHVMQAIGARTPPYDNLCLSVNLHDLQMPAEGELRVPIHARVEQHPQHWECRLEIDAAQDQRFFPKFTGTVTVTPDGRNECELWLQGRYEPPMGAIGAGINAALLHGAAERSLRKFLEWLAQEISKSVAESERIRLRRARNMHV